MALTNAEEGRVLDALDQLSPKGRREALRRLVPSAVWLDQAVERNRPRIEAIARERGLDWNSLNEEKRQQFIDQILHE